VIWRDGWTNVLIRILAAFMFARGSYADYVAVAALLFVSRLFDEMDGMVAWIKFRESSFGTWLDGFADNATYLTVFGGIVVGRYRQCGTWTLKYGVTFIMGYFISIVVVTVQRKLTTHRPPEADGHPEAAGAGIRKAA